MMLLKCPFVYAVTAAFQVNRKVKLFGKEKTGFTVYGPHYLLCLQRRVRRNSSKLLFLQTALQHSNQRRATFSSSSSNQRRATFYSSALPCLHCSCEQWRHGSVEEEEGE